MEIWEKKIMRFSRKPLQILHSSFIIHHSSFPLSPFFQSAKLLPEFKEMVQGAGMNEILKKVFLSNSVVEMEIRDPKIARKHRAGQFIIFKLHEQGERIPLTVADKDPEKGTLTIIFQQVGKSTTELGGMNPGMFLLDLVGPLGTPTHIEKYGTVVCIGGGIGTAPIHPITQAMKQAGNEVIAILGARNKELIIMEDKMRKASDEIIITTDDGSYCNKGFVTDSLKSLIQKGRKIDKVVAVGPVLMMKAVCKATEEYGISTMVSLNPIMLDGTGMCGACRVSVGNETKFVCVDGPEFDGHKVDFDQLMKRQRMYVTQEREAMDKFMYRQGCQNPDGQKCRTRGE